MASAPRESLHVEPAVKARGANHDLRQKNNRASHNWQKVRLALETERKNWVKGAQDDRNKLLKQRDVLRNTSLNLSSSDSVQTEEGASAQLKPRPLSLKDVYDVLLKSSKQQPNNNGSEVKSVKSEPASALDRRQSTVSFEQKRVGRKPITFSLHGLQKANSNLQSKKQAMEKAQQRVLTAEDSNQIERPQSGPPPSHFDLNDEELSLGPTLKLPPTHLPPITKGISFKPHVRSFKKDEEFKKRTKGGEHSFDDIRYCRYLRKRGRSRSDTTEPMKLHQQRRSARSLPS